MIIQYREGTGEIWHAIFDPISPEARDFFMGLDHTVEFPPAIVGTEEVDDGEGNMIEVEVREAVAVDMLTQFYDIANNVLADRPTFGVPEEVSLQVGEEQEIPLPAGVLIGGTEQEVTTDGSPLVLGGDGPGEFYLSLTMFPYQPAIIKVTVSA
ncbi:hypothetical protein EVC30_010 [Rhizobium phage RHph_Y1_11]|nr:hypothetical protein EVC30_010 [Rhizobium phage RHph_Y1_11]